MLLFFCCFCKSKMTLLVHFEGLCGVFIAVLLGITPQGSHSELVVITAGSTQVNAQVGDTVSLAVTYSGATNPAIIWRKGNNPIVTWTINSSTPPDIPQSDQDVLSVDTNGSLIFKNVTLAYTSRYSLEMTKSGQSTTVVYFMLTVYEILENVTLQTQPALAAEGVDSFILQYAKQRGIVEEQMWFFNGTEIKNNSHYSVEQKSLVILRPRRNDTGLYTLFLKNPYSNVTLHKNVTVFFGPDEPIIEASPMRQFYMSGVSVHLSCKAEGLPPPTAKWMFAGLTLPNTNGGDLNLNDVQTSQAGDYTCTVLNEQTKEIRQKNITVKIYEKPKGSPVCSVTSVDDVDLLYECSWSGGTPEALLSFPELNNSSSGAGRLSLNVTASDGLSGTPVYCVAHHPVQLSMCNVTARRPGPFQPSLQFGEENNGKIVVIINCLSEALPKSVVSWSKGGEAVSSSSMYQISNDTTQLYILDSNVSTFLLHNYTCTCHNPLGTQQREIQLMGPTISDSSLFPNQDGTVITLTWEVPPTSIVTGFDIQMKGPDLLGKDTQVTLRSNEYRTIQQMPGSARKTDIFGLDPKSTYQFQVIPKALLTEGKPSVVHRIGPGDGLSGSFIAGIAAGIPCSFFLLLVLLILFLFFIYKQNTRSQARYPVTTAHNKVIMTRAEIIMSNNIMLSGGRKIPPDYNQLQQTPSQQSLPSFVPPPPVRVATTV